MKEQLICFETAKLASEKGFNIPVRNAFFEDGREDAEKFIMCYDCGYIKFNAPLEEHLKTLPNWCKAYKDDE